MKYLAYHFTVLPPQPGSDILIALLGEGAFESFDTTANGFTAYLPESADPGVNLSAIELEGTSFQWIIEEIAEQNWNASWESNFEPVVVENLVCIRAHFHPHHNDVKYNIEITPKMSFGTGHHDTTWQMCKALFDLDVIQKSVLDMGCGTGVLAILAKKLGAGKTLAIDIDEWSVENSIENCQVNGASDIDVKKGDASVLPEKPTFDVILANINKNVLKQDMNRYFGCMNTNGHLLLSGFFTTDVEELKQQATLCGFQYSETSSRNGWAILHLKK